MLMRQGTPPSQWQVYVWSVCERSLGPASAPNNQPPAVTPLTPVFLWALTTQIIYFSMSVLGDLSSSSPAQVDHTFMPRERRPQRYLVSPASFSLLFQVSEFSLIMNPPARSVVFWGDSKERKIHLPSRQQTRRAFCSFMSRICRVQDLLNIQQRLFDGMNVSPHGRWHIFNDCKCWKAVKWFELTWEMLVGYRNTKRMQNLK